MHCIKNMEIWALEWEIEAGQSLEIGHSQTTGHKF